MAGGDRPRKIRKLRPDIQNFSVATELPALLQRVRGNKNKLTVKGLVQEGPLRLTVVALDTGGKLEEKYTGAVAVQCLLGSISISAGGPEVDVSTGDVALADAGAGLTATAKVASALLVIEARGEEEG